MGSDVTPFSATPARGRKKLTLAAYKYIARKRFSRQAEIDLKSIAEKSWEIAPSETTVSPRAIFLPNQLERVTGWEFHPFEHPRRTMEGGLTVDHGATRGYLIKDVWLIDGALYKDDACHWLSLRPTQNSQGL